MAQRHHGGENQKSIGEPGPGDRLTARGLSDGSAIASGRTGRQGDFDVDNQIGFLLRQAHQRASANLIARIGRYDLTPPQANVLCRLEERGGVSQNLLGRLVAMEPPNIRDVVQRLAKRKLIRLDRSAEDQRVIIASLTPAGRSLVKKIVPLAIAGLDETLAPLSVLEREQLRRFLRRIASPR